MRKIGKWLIWLFLIVLLLGLEAKGEKQEPLTYQDEVYHFQFVYPQGWTLDKTASKEGYLALYAPESLAAREKYKTMDLLCETT